MEIKSFVPCYVLNEAEKCSPYYLFRNSNHSGKRFMPHQAVARSLMGSLRGVQIHGICHVCTRKGVFITIHASLWVLFTLYVPWGTIHWFYGVAAFKLFILQIRTFTMLLVCHFFLSWTYVKETLVSWIYSTTTNVSLC